MTINWKTIGWWLMLLVVVGHVGGDAIRIYRHFGVTQTVTHGNNNAARSTVFVA